MTDIPIPNGEDIQIEGVRVTLAVRRCSDGSAVFAMTDRDLHTMTYALLVTPANVMTLVDFMLNRPATANG